MRRSLPVRILGLVLLAVLALAGGFQRSPGIDGTTPPAGLRENTPRVHALVGARLVVAPGKTIPRGTIVVRDGLIAAVGDAVAVPPDAKVHDLTGKTIYPGLIDAFSEASVPAAGAGSYWNSQVVPQTSIATGYTVDADLHKKLRSQGITARLVAPADRIVKGVSALLSTGEGTLGELLLNDRVALHLRLTPQQRERNEYPTSPMGALALVRQVFYDAQWYGQAWDAYRRGASGASRPEQSTALAALEPFLQGATVVVDAPNVLYLLRADQVGREFDLNLVVRGSGYEYRRLDAVHSTGRAVLLPVNFPKAPYVKTAEAVAVVPLEDLLHWDLAPENPGRLAAAGVRIALTTHGLKDPAQFLEQVRVAVRRGLSPDSALRALTTTPAELFGLSSRLGTLEPGRLAHLVVTDGELFDSGTRVLETWVDGRRYEVQRQPLVDAEGTWAVQIGQQGGEPLAATLELSRSGDAWRGTLHVAQRAVALRDVQLEAGTLNALLDAEALGRRGLAHWSTTITAVAGPGSAAVANRGANAPGSTASSSAAPRGPAADVAEWHLLGRIVWADSTSAAVQGSRLRPASAASSTVSADDAANSTPELPLEAPPPSESLPYREIRRALFDVNYPLGAFGRELPPEEPRTILFRNATIWTAGPQGVLRDASLLIEGGRIAAVGRDVVPPPDALIIDLRGKHVTPGLIDCHSHIATDGGVNESGQTVTAEVRIGDFIDSEDVNIYRHLAGGVTTINILHGSANTIGGQNQVIKLRWGALPDALRFAEAPPGIKFALGENVKQSNWGDRFTYRYPQTRMGVEQLLRSEFEAAREYAQRWADYRRHMQGPPPRVDLQLEALAEVLRGQRLIHCHSYRQDEILALLRTCEEFGVRVATLQHILEGYKLADEIARHGAGGSSFSDWWAYKFEVYDAIPYNGALMHRAGVVVSFNSDSAELARRLNTEAAKAIKYGGLLENEALQLVTLNPARQLGIDRYVGSLEVGKHADLVVWSASPLSSLARCEQTWIDGRKYFDVHEDQQLRLRAARQRAALVQRILRSGAPMAGVDEQRGGDDTLWPRHDIYCGFHHGHGERHRAVHDHHDHN
jgi:imidazolonepropionase-like amidohydrolase